MNKYIKNIIKSFIELDEELLEESEKLLKNKEDNDNYFITWSNLYYLIGIVSMIGISFYLYHNGWFTFNDNINNIGHLKQLDEIGEMIYKLSTEISKSCTVKSWETIHKVLKDLDTNKVDRVAIINELENLKKMNIEFPGQFSQNSECFEKSLIKLINFLKEIL